MDRQRVDIEPAQAVHTGPCARWDEVQVLDWARVPEVEDCTDVDEERIFDETDACDTQHFCNCAGPSWQSFCCETRLIEQDTAAHRPPWLSLLTIVAGGTGSLVDELEV